MTAPTHTLPVVHAAQLDEPDPAHHWLIESLWARAAVGLVGGAPKTNKTYLALDIALSVASATPCLGTFAVHDPGSVLLYMAEDAQAVVKERLLALCRHRQLDLRAVSVHVITAPTVRLDRDADQYRLENTVGLYRPRLLVLDPLVRMHGLNENAAHEIAALLAYLRGLQRAHDLAVLLFHHTRKKGSAAAQGGQNLRGSGDLYAWADCCLSLHRRPDARLILTPEHRAAASPQPIALTLLRADAAADDTHLHVVDALAPADPAQHRLEQLLLAALADAPQSRAQLRQALRIRNETLGHLLNHFAAQGRIVHRDGLWSVPFP